MHARKRMKEACAFALERYIGKQITVNIDIQALKNTENAQNSLPNIKNTIAIVSEREELVSLQLLLILLLD